MWFVGWFVVPLNVLCGVGCGMWSCGGRDEDGLTASCGSWCSSHFKSLVIGGIQSFNL
jgi:hypothetical protein